MAVMLGDWCRTSRAVHDRRLALVDDRLQVTGVPAAAPADENADPAAPIARRARLGDLLSYYYRPAA